MTSLDAVAKVLPVLLLFALGALLRQGGFLRPTTIDDLRRLVLDITLPAALFLAFLRLSLAPEHAIVVATIAVACIVVFGAGLLAVRFAGLRPSVAPGLLAGFEGGMIGYAIYGAVFGQDAIANYAIVDLGQYPFVFFVLPAWLARRGRGVAPGLGETLGGFVRMPVVLAIAAGVVASVVGLDEALEGTTLGDAALATLALVGGLTTPLIAIVIGYSTRLRRGALAAPIATVAVRLIVWVSFAVAFNVLVVDGILGLDRELQAALFTMATLPPPFVVPLFLRAAAARASAGEPFAATVPGPSADHRAAGPSADPRVADPSATAEAEHEYVVNTLSVATMATLVAYVGVVAAFAG